MVDKEKKSFKEKKQERQQKKVDKFTQQKELEAKRSGADKSIDIGPLGAERKAKIDAIMKEGVKEDFLGGLKKIQDVRTPPEVDLPGQPKPDYTIEDVRRERRAKIADVLTGLGSGLRGERVDPKTYQGKLKSERDTQYQQYKDTSEAAKKRLSEWESAYIDEQLDYLSKLKQDPKTTDRELKQIELLEQRLRKETALATKAEKEAKLVGKSPSSSQKYDTETYKTLSGETIRRQIPSGQTSTESKIKQDIELRKQLEPIDKEIEQKEEQIKIMRLSRGKDDSAISGVNIASMQAELDALNAQRNKLIKQETETKPTIKPTTIEEDDIWDL